MSTTGTFSKLKEQEKDARKNIIIDAAEKEFASKPFTKVNMRDIARIAGISPASIYRYFPDQQSLFVEAFVRGTREIFQKLHDFVEESTDGSIETVTDEFIDYFTRNDQYFRMMMHFFLNDSVDADTFEKLSTLERQLLGDLDSIFKKMNFQGNYRIMAHTLFASLVGIMATFRNHPAKNADEELAHRKKVGAILANLFKSGIG